MKILKNLRLFSLVVAASAAFSACNSGTGSGDTNVEKSDDKQALHGAQGNSAGDSTTAGMRRSSDTEVTGREQFEKAEQSVDRDKDGLAD